MSNSIDFLTGIVRIRADCPDALKSDVQAFYSDPNNAGWDQIIPRVLYHESVHFWQFIASAYLGNLIADEWRRVLEFRERGTFPKAGNAVLKFTQRAEGSPFSPQELMECWARFWDVHTRGPHQILKEEGIAPASAPGGRLGYSGNDWDLVMQRGMDHSKYEKPYHWMLEELRQSPWIREDAALEKIRDGVVSYLLVLVFPSIVHAAFGSPDPVDVACRAIRLVAGSKSVGQQILKNKTQRINHDWLNSWAFCQGEILRPVLADGRYPSFTSGADVITRGALQSHPLYRPYLNRLTYLQGQIKLEAVALDHKVRAGDLKDVEYRVLLANLPAQFPWILFALPGQPTYRLHLGTWLQPPMVHFKDHSILLRPTPMAKVLQLKGEDPDTDPGSLSLKTVQDLERLVREFRAAEYAVSLGLKPDALR